MGYMIRRIGAGAKLGDEVALEAIARAVPRQVVQAVVADLGVTEKRLRKLPAELTMLLVIAMNLFTHQSIGQVLVKMLKGLRLIRPSDDFLAASKGGICQARYRLGARPMVELFHRVCRPLAKEATRGAFVHGLRLMALDTAVCDMADTPANARVYGRCGTDRGQSGFPQALAAYLEECGSHAVIDAGLWPVHADHHKAAQRLLRCLEPGMLLMWDSGLHSFAMAAKTRARGAHFLGRVPGGAKLTPLHRLGDGSYLATIRADQKMEADRNQEPMVRVIEYTIRDPGRQGYNERHRLMTSLVDAAKWPALELACLYHERWEIELTIDELKTHQRVPWRPWRSKKPVGVVQEFYALLVAHYAVRAIMHDCALEHDLDPDRLSFTNSLELVCNAIDEFQLVDSREHPALYQRLLADIAHFCLPQRANRTNPRVVKRKMSKFNLKRPGHRNWPQPTMPFSQAVLLLIQTVLHLTPIRFS